MPGVVSWSVSRDRDDRPGENTNTTSDDAEDDSSTRYGATTTGSCVEKKKKKRRRKRRRRRKGTMEARGDINTVAVGGIVGISGTDDSGRKFGRENRSHDLSRRKG